MQTQRLTSPDTYELDPRAVVAAEIMNGERVDSPAPYRVLPITGELSPYIVAELGDLVSERREGGLPRRIIAATELAIRGFSPTYKQALEPGSVVDQSIALAAAGLPRRQGVSYEPITFEPSTLPPLAEPGNIIDTSSKE